MEKILKPSKQQVIEWVLKAWRELQKRQKLIVNSFGISSCLDGSEDKLVRCGQYITEQMQSEVDEALRTESFRRIQPGRLTCNTITMQHVPCTVFCLLSQCHFDIVGFPSNCVGSATGFFLRISGLY